MDATERQTHGKTYTRPNGRPKSAGSRIFRAVARLDRARRSSPPFRHHRYRRRASRLVDRLIVQGYEDVTVLDLSAAALAAAKARIGEQAHEVHWLVADVTTWEPSRVYDVWHDRATLHFLTEAADQAAYLSGFGARYGPAATSSSALSRLTAPRNAAGCPSRGTTPRAWVERLDLGLSLSIRAGTITSPPGARCSIFSSALSGSARNPTLQEHPPVARDRLRQMLGDGADAAKAARVLVCHQPIGPCRAALGQDPDEVLEPARDEIVHDA